MPHDAVAAVKEPPEGDQEHCKDIGRYFSLVGKNPSAIGPMCLGHSHPGVTGGILYCTVNNLRQSSESELDGELWSHHFF
jgi:hypothetical protein